jgi:hypothetical protein
MPATVLGGFFPTNGVSTLSTAHNTARTRRVISQMLSKKGNLFYRRVGRTLNGVVPGSTATETRARVNAAEDLSGKRVIETETMVNRATTAGDVTDITADFYTLSTKTTFGSSPVANLDGNPLGTR